jgi:hypothetical protein
MILIALLLVVEGLSTGLWIARLVPRLSGFDAFVVVLMVMRGLVGAMQLTGGVFLLGRRAAAVTLSRWALIASAILTTLEIGERLAPSGLVPSLRWPLVGAYWIYALGAVAYLGRDWEVQGEKNREVQEKKNQEVQEEKNREVQEEKNREVRIDEPGSTGGQEH